MDAQADLSLRSAHTQFVGFVMSRLVCRIASVALSTPLKEQSAVSVLVLKVHGQWSDDRMTSQTTMMGINLNKIM